VSSTSTKSGAAVWGGLLEGRRGKRPRIEKVKAIPNREKKKNHQKKKTLCEGL